MPACNGAKAAKGGLRVQDVVLDHICKSFDGTPVLQNISAVLPAGQITCLMGPSGCGKTTLVNILLGLLPADSGTITGLPRRLSAVFQEDRLLEEFSATLNAGFASPKLPRAVVRSHLKAVGLADAADSPAGTLSGGMKRRVAIVRAVLATADFLLLDEPFKGLDDDTRRLVMEYLMAKTRGKTLLVVTHSAHEAAILGGTLLHLAPIASTGE